MSSARRAERASEAGARGRINKIAGRLITAILFGSAARRCSWENRIFCYQMTVLVEAFCAEALLFEDGRRCFLCGVRELKRYTEYEKRRLERKRYAESVSRNVKIWRLNNRHSNFNNRDFSVRRSG